MSNVIGSLEQFIEDKEIDEKEIACEHCGMKGTDSDGEQLHWIHHSGDDERTCPVIREQQLADKADAQSHD